jgi:hypothetical protein
MVRHCELCGEPIPDLTFEQLVALHYAPVVVDGKEMVFCPKHPAQAVIDNCLEVIRARPGHAA